MNKLDQIALLVHTARELDSIKGSDGARTARDSVLAIINTDLELMADPDSGEEPSDVTIAESVDDLRIAVRRLLSQLDPAGKFYGTYADNLDRFVIEWVRPS